MTTPRRSPLDGRASVTRLLARAAVVERYCAHAQKRSAEHAGSWHGRIWAAMVADFQQERAQLQSLLDRKRAATKAA